MPTADYSSYHQGQGTTSDGAKFDNFIDAVQASVNGLDGSNIAASAALSIASLTLSGNLLVNGQLRIGSILSGGAVSGAQKAVQLYNSSGVSQGFIPVYATYA